MQVHSAASLGRENLVNGRNGVIEVLVVGPSDAPAIVMIPPLAAVPVTSDCLQTQSQMLDFERYVPSPAALGGPRPTQQTCGSTIWQMMLLMSSRAALTSDR